MPLLYESSDDSGQVVINGASQGAVISTGQKVSPARKASANFAKLNRRNIVFKDESAQRLRKINGNDTMADLVPVHSSVGRSARRGRGLKGGPSIPENVRTQPQPGRFVTPTYAQAHVAALRQSATLVEDEAQQMPGKTQQLRHHSHSQNRVPDKHGSSHYGSRRF